MTKKEFLKAVKDPYRVVGEFKNAAGEDYVVIRTRLLNVEYPFFIAGDETDWEMMHLDKTHQFAYKYFEFSNNEKNKIDDLLTDKN